MFKHLLTIVALFGMVSCGEVSEAPQEKPEMPTSSEVPDAKPDQERSNLELSLPETGDSVTTQDLDLTKLKVLPDFFEEAKEKEEEKEKAATGAKFMNDPTKENYVESVTGEELKVEIPNN